MSTKCSTLPTQNTCKNTPGLVRVEDKYSLCPPVVLVNPALSSNSRGFGVRVAHWKLRGIRVKRTLCLETERDSNPYTLDHRPTT